MEQRDLLKAEIERMGQAIGKVVARFLGTSGNNLSFGQRQETIRNDLKDGPDLSLDLLLNLDEEALLELARSRHLTGQHLEQLSDFFAAWAQEERLRETRLILAKRAALLLDLSDRISGNYCFTRAQKATELHNFIENQKK